MIRSLIAAILLSLATSAQAQIVPEPPYDPPRRLACFGDSISTESDVNASYCRRVLLPEGWEWVEHGRPAAPCLWVLDLEGSNLYQYGPGDVVVIMCRSVFEEHHLNVAAAIELQRVCQETGADCIFATQPAWCEPGACLPEDQQPVYGLERIFAQQVQMGLDPETIWIDTSLHWRQFGWHRWSWIYDPDGVHMERDGALLIAHLIEQAMRYELCNFAPMWCPE